MAPGCRSALEPGCVGLKRRQQRIQLGVDGGQFQCPLLGLRLRLSRPNGQQNVRWARRILPSSQAGPNPLGENITFFLSPAQAAGAPTFCDAAESKQRSQPRGLRPLGQPPPVLPSLAKPSCGPPPAVLCKASSNLRVPSGTEPRPGWRWLAHSCGVQISCLQPNSQVPDPKNCSVQRLLAAHLGDSFYFAKCEIIESLLRRGARCRSATS
jgi:hypothetical protein